MIGPRRGIETHMVCGDQGAIGPSHLAAGVLETFEGLLWGKWVSGCGPSQIIRFPLTGEVTSWTRCLSMRASAILAQSCKPPMLLLTDIDQKGSIVSFIHDMVFQDLIVQRTRRGHGRRHFGQTLGQLKEGKKVNSSAAEGNGIRKRGRYTFAAPDEHRSSQSSCRRSRRDVSNFSHATDSTQQPALRIRRGARSPLVPTSHTLP